MEGTTSRGRSHPMMRAVSQAAAGGSDVLEVVEVPRPIPSPTEVLVRVHAAGVNPTDWKTRARGRFMTGAVPPFILGFDVSGVVETVGPGVTIFEAGDEVFGMPKYPNPAGAYAEFLAAPARHFAPKPTTCGHVEAAALPLAALTAWQALVDTAGVKPGDRVLVHGAGGGVGHLAVQIAKARGAHVVGTARSDKHPLLRALGADELVDYTVEDFTTRVRDVDVVLDAVGGGYAARSLVSMRRGGVLVSLLELSPDFPVKRAHELDVRALRMLVEPDHAGMLAIAGLVENGSLRPIIDSVLPLCRAGEAHVLGESNRTLGKIVLTVRSPRCDTDRGPPEEFMAHPASHGMEPQ